MAPMMQSNVKDTYCWETLRYKYWIILGDGKTSYGKLFKSLRRWTLAGFSFKFELWTLTETLLLIEAKRWGPLNLYFWG